MHIPALVLVVNSPFFFKGNRIALLDGVLETEKDITVHVASGEEAIKIGTGILPGCFGRSGAGYFVEILHTDTNQVVSRRGPLTKAGQFILQWDTANHPKITPALAGTYLCQLKSDKSGTILSSRHIYKLHVASKYSIIFTFLA